MAKFTDPIEVRGQRVKNRILMSAMTTSRAEEDGAPSAWSRAHYEARARGGAAVCFTEATYVNQEGKGFPNQLGTHDDALIAPLGELVRAVEAAGAPLAVQLYHAGRTALSAITGMEPVGPSPIPHPTEDEVPREMSEAEIKAAVKAYGEAARRVREAGGRFLEIHGATWYLCQQFFSPASNRRTDGYGGTLAGRMRFPLEVAQAVREGAGEEMVVSYRMGLLEPFEDGFTVEDALALAPALVEAGMDILHCSRNARVGLPVKPDLYDPAFARLRKAVDAPLVANGAAFEPSRMRAYLDAGADFVGVGRAMLTDPDYANKAISGRGGEILRCVECKPCAYMTQSRCPDEAYPSGVPESMREILDAASRMSGGGYAPTARKRPTKDAPIEAQPEESSIS